MAEADEESSILDRLAARSSIPELEPFHLARDWRADEVRNPSDYCSTCRWDGCWEDMIWDARLERSNSDGGIAINSLKKSAAAGNLCCAVLLALVRKFKGTSIWFDHLRGLVVGKERTYVTQIYLCHDENDVDTPPGATLYFQGRHPHMDPRSDAALSWAQGHIYDCVHKHDCSDLQSETHGLPTRLVYISGDDSNDCIRLITDTTSLPSSTRYAALTHCWGEIEPQCLTTVDNIDTYSKGISWATIPQTFRDALTYTRRLGLEYIWIDSICVIQKNRVDWEKESTRMCDYFSNAFVTLGSTFGVDSTAGFFSERHIQAFALYLFDIIFKGTTLRLYARRSVGEVVLLDAFDINRLLPVLDGSSYPLFMRAWTYQERLVSPRLLLFTKYQLFYECYAERRLHDSQEMARSRTLKSAYKLLLTGKQLRNQTASWQELVTSFNALRLSFVTDKLPAFAAVAQQYLSHQILANSPEQEYLCGLRKSHLHHDLLWTREGPLKPHGEQAAYSRSSSYLAPSWSWASVPQRVEYDQYWLNQSGRSTVFLEGEFLTFTEAGRFGRALCGYIAIRGPVIDCTLPPIWLKGDKLSFDGGQ